METPTRNLEGIGVLVTRPEHQADNLCHLIHQHGGQAIRFPVLEIQDIENKRSIIEQIKRLHEYDIAIFISPNAVNKAVNLIQAHRVWPEQVKIAAVGKSSAKALDSLGLMADIFPSKRFNSEALLELEELQHVRGKHIIIFRGDGGRELIAETLKARGALVDYAECYKRGKPEADVSVLLRHWARGDIDITVTTSNEGLHNLYDMVGQLGRQWLIKTPMVVVSERAADLAMQLGFQSRPIVANQASDEAILDSIFNWSTIRKS